MKNPQILIFGDQEYQNKKALHLLESYYEVKILSFEHYFSFNNKDLFLVIILQTNIGDHGLNKLKEIRRFHPDFPILFIMENSSQENIIEIFREGAADFLRWPVNPHLLISRIQQHFDIKQKRWLHPTGIFQKWFLKSRKYFLNIWQALSQQSIYKSENFIAPVNAATLLPLPKLVHEVPSKIKIKVNFFEKMSISFLDYPLLCIKGKKARSLLAYLIYHHKRPIHRDILMNTFWPFTRDTSARNSLNVCLHHIRKEFKKTFHIDDIINYDNGFYSFSTDIIFDLDTDRFSRNWKRGTNLEQSKGLSFALEEFHHANALYHGDFLENMRYENWMDTIRENLRETYLAILAKLSLHHFELNNYTITINLCKKILEKDSCLEEIHHRLMYCLFKLGMRDRAIRQFHRCRQSLKEELKITPSQKIITLLEQIKNAS